MIVTQKYRDLMSDNDRKAYDVLVEGIINNDVTVVADKADTDIPTLIDYIHYDHPQLFSFRAYAYSVTDSGITVEPSYLYSPQDYFSLRKKCIKLTKDIIRPFKKLDDYDKVKGIHDWMCIHYQYEDIDEESHSIIGPLLYNIGVCEGFSELFKLLMDMLDVPCSIPCGIVAKERHAWNCVQIRGKWYHVDVTFDINHTIERFPAHDYFLLTDREIVRDRTIENRLCLCRNPEMNYYVKNGLLLQNQSDLISMLDALRIDRFPFCIDFRLPETDNNEKVRDNVNKICQRMIPGKIGFGRETILNFNEPTMTFRIIIR